MNIVRIIYKIGLGWIRNRNGSDMMRQNNQVQVEPAKGGSLSVEFSDLIFSVLSAKHFRKLAISLPSRLKASSKGGLQNTRAQTTQT